MHKTRESIDAQQKALTMTPIPEVIQQKLIEYDKANPPGRLYPAFEGAIKRIAKEEIQLLTENIVKMFNIYQIRPGSLIHIEMICYMLDIEYNENKQKWIQK